MINEMRKLHLGLKAQRGPRQSPGLRQLTDAVLAGNDDGLAHIGMKLRQQETQLEKDGRIQDMLLRQIDSMVEPLLQRYQKLDPRERAVARETIQGRVDTLEKMANSEDVYAVDAEGKSEEEARREAAIIEARKDADGRKLVALRYLQRNLPGE